MRACIFIICVILAGCETINTMKQGDDATLLTRAAAADREMADEGKIKSLLSNINLDSNDQIVVNRALNAYSAFALRWGDFIHTNRKMTAEQRAELYVEYQNLRERYAGVKNVIAKHWGSFSGPKRNRLAQLNTVAESLDKSVQGAYINKKTRKIIKKTIKIGKIVYKICIKLI